MRPSSISFLVFLPSALAAFVAGAQTSAADSLPTPFQRGGIYDRPYILKLGGNTALGGYAEMNSNYRRVDGISEGFSLEQRRFNVFLYSAVSAQVKLTAELEFEHGTEEIALETALVDVLFATPVNLRAGILLSPIGRFNITHDSPRYNVIDRPLVSTEIIPATLSEVGVGFFGAFYLAAYDRFTYELYAVNGLGEGVVLGSGEGTRIPLGKTGAAFAEDNNGSPALSGRLAYNPRFGGEFGVSLYTGRYNTWQREGVRVDAPRSLRLLAVDAEFRKRRLLLRGEAALAQIELPQDHADDDLLAEWQRGFYVEGNYTLLQRRMLNMPEAGLIAFGRCDYLDLNHGTFDKTGQNIGDSITRVTAGLAFRPTADTVIRLSCWRQWSRDRFNNLSHAANIQFGLATYF
ncbi:MAG: hypothetical protein ONB48_07705 [candidate division KSB1 bacterium]|nr:hypothetical protein [candidate division KSB1 bacterium]MDZ7274707.1 hypothetical protein [candidate division KSB1 bacterium]MDZ7285532.1 hypothetical protein [candidate division KSB1 bacterium]MDZ7298564.1 hypothetical protein [candidate division KSB1 bacterium]MDZ7306584.1 hypothetical protein [candidate division KSB1 bacterium]